MTAVGDINFAVTFPRFDGDALCAETDPEQFHPEVGDDTRAAKAICRRCAVIDECLDWALENDEQRGVWGGTSPMERRFLARNRRRRSA